MIRKQKYIISSTHLDSHGDVIMKSALESMLPQLNGKRKPRLGLEHIRTFPPFGAISNGEVFQGVDKQYYLSAEMLYFDKQEFIKLGDGTKLVKEYFSEGEYPFIECEETETTKLSIAADPANFEKQKELNAIYELIRQESDLDFDTSEFRRKSYLANPEIIISITTIIATTIIATTIGIVKSKITKKLGDVIGEDLAKFYKLLSKLAMETIKKAKPSNRPKNFVISYPNTECNIELVITTHSSGQNLKFVDKRQTKISC